MDFKLDPVKHAPFSRVAGIFRAHSRWKSGQDLSDILKRIDLDHRWNGSL